MYNVYNKSEIYYFWNIDTQQKYLIGNEKELVHWLAKQYRPDVWCGSELHNDTLDSFACHENDLKYGKHCQILDGFDRCINPKIYEREARLLYLNYYKHKMVRSDYFYWRKNNVNYVFRYDPVPHTHKRKGGPCVRPRRIKSLKQMYANPEYKEFNRGSHKDVPDGWWDDWYRCNQKNWKKQSKRRHQWKENVTRGRA
jgi:hypothetical protein